jgi:hypothetical protein
MHGDSFGKYIGSKTDSYIITTISLHTHRPLQFPIDTLQRRSPCNSTAPTTQSNSVGVSHLFGIHKMHAELPVPSTLNVTLISDKKHISDVNACQLFIGMVCCWARAATRFDVRDPDDPDKGCSHRSGPIYREKGHWRIVIGHLALARSTLLGRASWDAGADMELTGCLLHVVIVPSLFRNAIQARTCVPTALYTARQATATWTPCIS